MFSKAVMPASVPVVPHSSGQAAPPPVLVALPPVSVALPPVDAAPPVPRPDPPVPTPEPPVPTPEPPVPNMGGPASSEQPIPVKSNEPTTRVMQRERRMGNRYHILPLEGSRLIKKRSFSDFCKGIPGGKGKPREIKPNFASAHAS